MVVDLIDRLVAAARRDPSMHVYHYAPYEVTALKKLTGGYGIREAQLDQLLREERFVDLYPVVRQSMRISKESYSIKKVEAFYGRSHEGEVASGLGSVLVYEQWLVDGDQQQLDDIESYNKDDVDSTRELHEWLEQQRAELEAVDGEQPRPSLAEDRPGATVSEVEAAELALSARLHDAGHQLLGDLVQWHRREDRPAWWDVFRLQTLDREALIEDGTALGGLSEPVDRGKEINGVKAVELGLAWESVDYAAVEDRAPELAARVAADPELARVAVGNFRKEVVNGATGWDVAMQYERPAQMWSMRRSVG